MPKKLIEVALPLEAINAESAREKSIRHGHPSTLHLWWARRPLAAARAVIWSSLVDDPSEHPEQFPTEEEQNKERQRLFNILEKLVKWENSNDPEILDAAKAEILRSTGNNPPPLLDPFAGGGAIPLEAQRLGLEAHAHDLNPVAVMINKAMIEIPPKFAGRPPVNPEAQRQLDVHGNWKGASGLAEDVRYYGQWMKEQAFQRIGHLYPKVKVPAEQGGGEATVIAWIWARTVASPDPAAQGAYVPLISSKLLSSKNGVDTYVEIVNDASSADGWRFEIKTGKLDKATHARLRLGTKAGRGKDFICCLTNSVIPRSYIQAEGKAGRLSRRLMAIVASGSNGRIYISPIHSQAVIADDVTCELTACEARESFLSASTPTRAMITGGVCSAYGLDTWGKLFTNRQLNALSTFSELVNEVRNKIETDAVESGMRNTRIGIANGGVDAWAYGEAVSVYLAFTISKMADRGSSICSWDSSREGLRNTFGRQAIPMAWDYAESNPFCNASGCFDNMLDWVYKCILEFPASTQGETCQFDAQSDCGLREIMVSTDPPYYDNIGYADLSDFFYVWMRQSLKSIYPNLFRTMLVPKAEELVATPYRFNGSVEKARDFFEEGMLHTCKQIYQYAREDIPVTIYYAYKQSDTETSEAESKTASTGWETMLSAVIQAGFSITGTWPMRTEMANRSIASGTNALASSIVLVCRKRDENARTCTRRNFVTTLKRELKPALQKLQQSNIAPVDLAQSAIGPGIGVFSRYKKVLESDGSPMTVRSALQIINQELDLYFSGQDSSIDSDSRLCVELFTQYAFNTVKFGDADVLARAKGTSVAKLAGQDILYAAKGDVRLLTREELPEKIKTGEQNIWLLTQQLTHAMETGGIQKCAEIIAPMFGNNAEEAKNLAYRLYSICERKNWAQEAYAYNALVVAWPEIQSKAAELQAIEPVQIGLFE